jgi:hypothetical protein
MTFLQLKCSGDRALVGKCPERACHPNQVAFHVRLLPVLHAELPLELGLSPLLAGVGCEVSDYG